MIYWWRMLGHLASWHHERWVMWNPACEGTERSLRKFIDIRENRGNDWWWA